MMAQTTDRWSSKILALPLFSDEFAQAIARSQYVNLALIAAMEVRSPGEFVAKVHEWESALDEEIKAVLLTNQFMLEQYWSLASSVEKAFFESTAVQLGFGLCDPTTIALSSDAARARRARAIKSMNEKPLQQPRKIFKKTDEDNTATPLLDKENAARWKWAAKLEAIGHRAGPSSKLLSSTSSTSSSEGLTASESARLRQLVLSSGAPRTMAVHIASWERFEEWAVSNKLNVFPLSQDVILKYALFLDSRECGPTVVPSFRTAVKWVTSKLAIECPDLASAALLAVQNEIVQKRAKTLKEAVPFPLELVACLETFVLSAEEPAAARVFIWWWLCMVYASLRFDDALHVKPNEIVVNHEGLFGVAWQTKVERKRRGAKFAVPHAGFHDARWLQTGWDLLCLDDLDRDHWVCELGTREHFVSGPPTYQRSVQWLKFLARFSLNHYFIGPELRLKELIAIVPTLTAHSARVTMLDAAVHAGRSTEEIGLQANWKNPGPLVLKYTRNRTNIPAQMIQQLVKDMAEQAHPVEPDQDTFLDDSDETALDEVQFFIKTFTSRPDHDFRYHCSAVDDFEVLACKRLSREDCTAVGSALPDVAMLCKHCARARPDVESRCSAEAP